MIDSEVTIEAPAKTNLWLKVLEKRSDGYHSIETRMIRLSLADRLTIETNEEQCVEFTCSDPDLPAGEENLVIRAVRVLEKHARKKFGLKIHLEKKIPVGAGLGGGSSDAAAVFRGINELEKLKIKPKKLVQLAASIGSDIPFFLYDGPCDVSGRGEVVNPVPADAVPRLPVVLLKPGFSISAGWAYQSLEEAREKIDPLAIVPQVCPWGSMENDLEIPVFLKFPILHQMKDWLLTQPEVHAALLCGSGSTMMAILRDFDHGEPLIEKAKLYFGEETWTFRGHTC